MNISISSADLYKDYVTAMRKIADVKYASAVLQWDQETYLPAKGAGFRGQQLATLAEVAHELFVQDKTGDLLNKLKDGDNLNERQLKNVALSLEDYNKVKKFSPAFVRKMSETVSLAYHAWIKARRDNDFKVFEPLLTEIIDLKKQEAEILGYTQNRYDALLNEYEKGASVQMIDKIFDDVKQPLRDLLHELQALPKPDSSFLHQHFPKDMQWKWGQEIAGILGFDFSAGRQDISEHPFSTNFNNQDVRITTRIDENDFGNMTWSTIHEVGHALYEQGLPAEEYGLPIGEYASLSVHESQSRLWENCVGRGEAFWNVHFKKLVAHFPRQFKNVTVNHFARAINKIEPSFIRTEADELTYHFHVMIRYDIEKLLINGELKTRDIPAYWNEQYRVVLGVEVPGDLQGCLQDVHWSHGSFGYFPTYSLGSFYAAQFWQQLLLENAGLLQQLSENGDTTPILTWLRKNVHPHGRFFTSEELCTSITGKGLNSKVFVQYLREKMLHLYHLS